MKTLLVVLLERAIHLTKTDNMIWKAIVIYLFAVLFLMDIIF